MQLTPRQTEIINISINIISEKGIQQLTIKNIAKDMGISEPAIYRHFKSKFDILSTILSSFEDNGIIITDQVISAKTSSLKKMEAIFLNHFEQFSKNPALTAVIFSEEIFQNDAILANQVNKIMQGNQNTIFEIIETGQKNGEIRNDISKNQLSLIIMGSLRLIVTKWRLSKFSFDLNKEGIKLFNSIKKISLT